MRSRSDGACAVPADPDKRAIDAPPVWLPSFLPTVVPVAPAPATVSASALPYKPDELEASAACFITSDEAQHIVLGGPQGGCPGEAPVRAWITGPPAPSTGLAVLLPLDEAFPVRIRAAHRLWRVLNGRAPGRPPDLDTPQRKRRLALVLRSLDARQDGATYRSIAAALFGEDRTPNDATWRSHDLRSRTVRLVQDGLALMRGGYVKLLKRRQRS